MDWIILGLGFLVVTYLSLKGTVLEKYDGKNYAGKCPIPVWVLLVLGLLYIIPSIGVMFFIGYHIIFCICAIRKPDKHEQRYLLRLSKKNILHRILGAIIYFLNKEI